MFQVWLHPNEFEFLTNYAEENIYKFDFAVGCFFAGYGKRAAL